MKTRIMYIEYKGRGLTGPARIGRVTFSKTGRTLYYRGKAFQSLKGSGFKANYFDVETGEHYWISGPRRDGTETSLARHPRAFHHEQRSTADWKGSSARRRRSSVHEERPFLHEKRSAARE
jgi:hypothetical protein